MPQEVLAQNLLDTVNRDLVVSDRHRDRLRLQDGPQLDERPSLRSIGQCHQPRRFSTLVDTKLYGPKSLPGFNDFFGRRFSRQGFAADPSLAHKLLLAFRDGQWRQNVEFRDTTAVGAASSTSVT